MPEHDLDPVALVAGITFAGIGLAALLTQGAGAPARWVIPLLLIAVGVAGLLATRARERS